MSEGLPAELLLLFTFLVWSLYLLVYLSSPRNKVNQWCCICGFLLSVGVLKEYIYYGGLFAGMETELFDRLYQTDELVNSVLTAVLYYLAMPCVMILSFYFCELHKKYPRLFYFLAAAVFLPAAAFCAVYPWTQTREIPIAYPAAYAVVEAYNLIYGAAATALIIGVLFRERKSVHFRQRRMISVIGLLPLWYWLITIFLFHLLGVQRLYKLWQGNVVIVVALNIYYVWHLFHEGIWGMRLTREYFDWGDGGSAMPADIEYLIHVLKNEAAKIEYCTQSVRETAGDVVKDELDIIDRSLAHVREFTAKSGKYLGKIVIDCEMVNVRELFREVVRESLHGWEGRVVIDAGMDEADVYCDYYHMKETLCNLVDNAVGSMGETGVLTLAFRRPKRGIALIEVEDTGCGIPKEERENIFEPYRSGDSGLGHMGLGLTYCRSVARAHGGYIRVESDIGKERHGTRFTLCIPQAPARPGLRIRFANRKKHKTQCAGIGKSGAKD